jgi:HAD superfamily hydrolase (TIGR01509 family)
MTTIRPVHLLCDMDGTLIDTEGIKAEAWRRAVTDALGHEPDRDEYERLYTKYAGAPGSEMAKWFVAHYGLRVEPNALFDGRERYRREAYADQKELAQRAYDPLVAIIQRLRNGFRVLGSGSTVLVTTASQEQVDQIMGATDLRGLFDDIVSGLEKSVENPACYREALKRLDAEPVECIAIEDTVVGYEAARALGIPCLLLPNAYTRGQRLRDS